MTKKTNIKKNKKAEEKNQERKPGKTSKSTTGKNIKNTKFNNSYIDSLEEKIISQEHIDIHDFESIGAGQSTQKGVHKTNSSVANAGRKKLSKGKGDEDKAKKRKTRSREFAIVSYIFVGLFIMMIGYFVYFNLFLAVDVINSPYNTRQTLFEDRIIRGEIQARNGEVLARTDIYDDGTETRIYPYGSIFAHVVGYASHGRKGIESLENYSLLASNTFILNRMGNAFAEKKNQGDTVVTTLDVKLQEVAYSALAGYSGAVVVIDASTGKILVNISLPDFNPNTIDAEWEAINSNTEDATLLNRVYQGQYPPGSIFKMLTLLAYMRENSNYEEYTYECTGSITVGEGEEAVTVSCFGETVHGVQNLEQSLANSCNTSFCNIGLLIDNDAFATLAKEFFFNVELPVQLSSSISQFTLNSKSSEGESIMTAIGQGNTLVSPMQMAMITASIANGGILMKPYLIDRIESADGNLVTSYTPTILNTLMTTVEAEVLSRYMTSVVEYGTAAALSGNGYTVAGKTGSAEATEGTHSWFVGFSNVDNPDIIVSIVAENAGNSSGVAVPIAKQIFDAYYR